MAVHGANLTFEIRQLGIFHHSKGKSYTQISKLLNVKRCTVQKIVERFKKQGRIDYLNTNARSPRKVNERDERLVLRKVKLNQKLSAPKITSNIADECKEHVNPETIRRIIRRAGYNGRVARRKPLINERNRKLRLLFAWSIIRNKKHGGTM